MGIQGLLKQLKSITSTCHIASYKGRKVAIDAHCWLHRAAYSCARDLAFGLYTEKFISFFINMIDVLHGNGIEDVTIVFDGCSLPSKREVNSKRAISRQKHLELGLVAESLGDSKAAHSHFQQCITITSEMVHQLVLKLQTINVKYLISPYESDAQLACLSQMGLVDLVITEDSDSLVYGCKEVLFKMDSSGNGELIKRCNLANNRDISFANWTDDQFKLFCCLSGCDYLPKLRNVGLKTAHKVVSKYKTFVKVCDHMRSAAQYDDFTDSYVVELERAMMTFKHQTVFSPAPGRMMPLTPIPANTVTSKGAVSRGPPPDISYLGPILNFATTEDLVEGRLDPHTLQPFESSSPQYMRGSAKRDKVALMVARISTLSVQERRAMLGLSECSAGKGVVGAPDEHMAAAKSDGATTDLQGTATDAAHAASTSLPPTVHPASFAFPAGPADFHSLGSAEKAATAEGVSWAFDVQHSSANIALHHTLTQEQFNTNNTFYSCAEQGVGRLKRGRPAKKGSEGDELLRSNGKNQSVSFSAAASAGTKRKSINWSDDSVPPLPRAAMHSKHHRGESRAQQEQPVMSSSSSDRSQFVSPVVSSRFMTLNRRKHSLGAPLAGMAVTVSQGGENLSQSALCGRLQSGLLQQSHSVHSAGQVSVGELSRTTLGLLTQTNQEVHDRSTSVREGQFSKDVSTSSSNNVSSKFFDSDFFADSPFVGPVRNNALSMDGLNERFFDSPPPRHLLPSSRHQAERSSDEPQLPRSGNFSTGCAHEKGSAGPVAGMVHSSSLQQSHSGGVLPPERSSVLRSARDIERALQFTDSSDCLSPEDLVSADSLLCQQLSQEWGGAVWPSQSEQQGETAWLGVQPSFGVFPSSFTADVHHFAPPHDTVCEQQSFAARDRSVYRGTSAGVFPQSSTDTEAHFHHYLSQPDTYRLNSVHNGLYRASATDRIRSSGGFPGSLSCPLPDDARMSSQQQFTGVTFAPPFDGSLSMPISRHGQSRGVLPTTVLLTC